MTSSFEGIPCVVFEAMAMGLPIVAPDLPAIGELLGEAGDAVIARGIRSTAMPQPWRTWPGIEPTSRRRAR